MKFIIWIVFLFGLLSNHSTLAQLRVGDPGVIFDLNKLDPNYPQMEEWITAGVIGGIPFIEDLVIQDTLYDGASSSDINASIAQIANMGGGTLLLTDGIYNIDAKVEMQAYVSIIGESRDGVQCVIDMDSGIGFSFVSTTQYAGIYRLTIMGSWGEPQYDWNIGSDLNDELPGNDNVSVKFKFSQNCWLDQVTILNSARDPMRCNANHTTFRDLIVDGCHRKAGGAQGYFFIQDGYNLITGCQITHLRHISLQGSGVEYNVVYDNDFLQEVSFHSGDDGNNLIENNRITLPVDMPPGTSSPNPIYYAIMGPWSTQHTLSATDNFIYKNECIEYNQNPLDPPMRWSDPNLVYVGPKEVKPADPSTNFPALSESMEPIGETLYPVVLCTVGAVCDDGNPCTFNDSFDNECNCVGVFQNTNPFNLKAFLQGAMPFANVNNSILMRDDLRQTGLIPLSEPYAAIYDYAATTVYGPSIIDTSVLLIDDSNAIVDWMVVEFREASDSSQVYAICFGLLQRDGDIVGLDGISPIVNYPKGLYYLSIRHRNHLGIMTAIPINTCEGGFDFSDPNTAIYGVNPRISYNNNSMMLWAGNANIDKTIVFQGIGADIDSPFFDVLTATDNNLMLTSYLAHGYYHSDCNMDGKTIYQGSQNDIATIFFNVISFPTNLFGLTSFIIDEQLPK